MKTINEVVHVSIRPHYDGLDGLYVNGELVTGGDEYHDKAHDRIEAFIAAMRFMGWEGLWEGEVKRLYWVDAKEEDCWNGLADNLSELPLDKMETSI